MLMGCHILDDFETRSGRPAATPNSARSLSPRDGATAVRLPPGPPPAGAASGETGERDGLQRRQAAAVRAQQRERRLAWARRTTPDDVTAAVAAHANRISAGRAPPRMGR